jgi:ABC-type multidrug transport system permease subunit
MSRTSNTSTHYNWEDWLGMALGVAILLTPLFATTTLSEYAVFATVIAATAIVALSALELVGLRRWQEWLLLCLGAFVVAAPKLLAYTQDGIAVWHVVLGLAVMALASAEFWQDRNATDAELARHGR